MNQSLEDLNKATVLKAFDLLFTQHDIEGGKRYCSADYIEHSAHIPPVSDRLFTLAERLPPEARYKNHLSKVQGDFVMTHGRFAGNGGTANLIAADIVQLKNGVLVEPLGCLAGQGDTGAVQSDRPMFGDSFLAEVVP